MQIFAESLNRIRAFLDLEHKGMNLMPIVTKNQQFDETLLSDFNKITTWLAEHVEVKFINIIFHIENTSIPTFTAKEDYLHFRKQASTFFSSLKNLPQIVIIDFKGDFDSIWSEFIYHCDFSIARYDTVFNFNHLQRGILPVSQETHNISSLLKNIFLTSQTLSAEDLSRRTGLVEIYSDERHRTKIIGKIKKNIFLSSPTCAIQLKHAFNGQNDENYQNIVHYTFLNRDWEKKERFSSVHEMKELLSKRTSPEKTEIRH